MSSGALSARLRISAHDRGCFTARFDGEPPMVTWLQGAHAAGRALCPGLEFRASGSDHVRAVDAIWTLASYSGMLPCWPRT
jgi:hypothetical protein